MEERAPAIFARVSEWTAFWAKLPADGATAGAVSHGRNAIVSADGSSLIRLWCDDFAAAEPGSSVLLTRTVAHLPPTLRRGALS